MLLMVSGIVTLGMILTISIRSKIARRAAMQPDPREMLARARSEQRERDTINHAMVEFHELTRRLAATLDDKTQIIEQLLEQADDRIARLRRLNGGAPVRTGEPRRGTRPADPGDEPDTPPPAPPPPPDEHTAAVYDLADAGHDPMEIARRLNEHPGRVELILSLREPR